ncbi:MAG: carboxypeptidase-like regulatory domain-containing protein [Planctomycetota bacterium]
MARPKLLLLCAIPLLLIAGAVFLLEQGGSGGGSLVVDGVGDDGGYGAVEAAADLDGTDGPAEAVGEGEDQTPTSTRELATTIPDGIGTIGGRVVDPLDRPLEGAEVRLFLGVMGNRDKGARPLDRVRSTADGSFRFEGLAFGQYQLLAHLPGRSHTSHTVRIRNLEPDQLGIRLVVENSCRLEVRVLDAAGQPLAGAHVLAAPQNGNWLDMDHNQGLSGADGRITFEELQLVPHNLVAWKPGHGLGYETRIQPWTGDQVHDVRLPEAGEHVLKIVVTDAREEDGGAEAAPATGVAEASATGGAAENRFASVRLRVTRQGSNFWFPLPGPLGRPQLDAEGKVEIEGLPEGNFNVAAFSEEVVLKDQWKQAVLGQEEAKAEARFEIVEGLALQGRVVDAATKRPAPGVHLTAWAQRSFGKMESAKTDDEGRFAFDRAFKKGDQVWVALDEPGYCFVQGDNLRANVRIEAGKPDQVFDLRGIPMLSGRVLGPGEQPVEGAVLTLFSKRPDGKGRQHRGTARSGKDGKFQLTPTSMTKDVLVLTGKTEDLLGEQDLAFGLAENGLLPEVVLRLDGGGVMAGRVVEPDRKPVAGAWVHITRAQPGQNPGQGLQGFQGWNGGFAKGMRTDSDGRFRFTGLEPGRYGVQLWAQGYVRPDRLEEVVLAMGQRRDDVELVVSPGLRITGKVEKVKGATLEGGYVTAKGPGTGPQGQPQQTHAVVDADGSFTLEGLVPGLHSLTIHPPWKVQQEWRKRDKHGNRPPQPEPPPATSVAAGSEGVTLVYQPPRLGSLRFAIRGDDGVPDKVKVTLAWEPKKRWSGSYPPQDGSVVVERLIPVRAKLTVIAAGYRPAERDIEILPGQETDIGIVRLEALPRLEAFVTDAQGRPLEGVEVGVDNGLNNHWKHGGGDRLVLARSDAQGRFELESKDGKTIQYVAWKPGYRPLSGKLGPDKKGRRVLRMQPAGEVLVLLPPGADSGKRDGKDWRPYLRIRRVDPPAPGKKPWTRTERFVGKDSLRLTGLPPGNYQVDVIDRRKLRNYDELGKDGHLLRRVFALQRLDVVELRIP